MNQPSSKEEQLHVPIHFHTSNEATVTQKHSVKGSMYFRRTVEVLAHGCVSSAC